MKKVLLEQLLREFNRKTDGVDVMQRADNFTIAYEVELEAHGYMNLGLLDDPYDDDDNPSEISHRQIERAAAEELTYVENFVNPIKEKSSDDFYDSVIQTGQSVHQLVDWYMAKDGDDFDYRDLEREKQVQRMRIHILASIGYFNGGKGFKKRCSAS